MLDTVLLALPSPAYLTNTESSTYLHGISLVGTYS